MSLQKFYRLVADPKATSRWYMKAPYDSSGKEVDPRLFTQGSVVQVRESLSLPLRQHGTEVDFNFADFDMPVVRSAINADLIKIAGSGIQRVDVTVDGRKGEFEILNVCELVKCVDESKSLVTKWTAADGRPDKVGEFRMIVNLKIDPVAAGDHDIFRIEGWPIALIVSEKVMEYFLARNVTGLSYKRVG